MDKRTTLSGQKHWHDRYNHHSSLSLVTQETSIGDSYMKSKQGSISSRGGYGSEKAKQMRNMLHTKLKFNTSVTDKNSQILKNNKNIIQESYAVEGQQQQQHNAVCCNTTATPVSADKHGECNWDAANGNNQSSRQCEESPEDYEDSDNVIVQINQFYRKNNNNNSNNETNKGQAQTMMMIPASRNSQVIVLKKDIFRHTLSYLDGITVSERKLEQKDKNKMEYEYRKKQIEQQQQQVLQGQQQQSYISESQTSGNTNNEQLHSDSSNSNLHISNQNYQSYRNTSMFKSNNNYLPVDNAPSSQGVIVANQQHFEKQSFPSVIVSGIPNLNQNNSIRNSIQNNPNSLTESSNAKINPIFVSTPGISSMKKIALLSIPLGDTPMVQSQVVGTFQTMAHFDEEQEEGGGNLESNVGRVCDCSGDNYDIKEIVESDSDDNNNNNNKMKSNCGKNCIHNANNQGISSKNRISKDLIGQIDNTKSIKQPSQQYQGSLASMLLSNTTNNNRGSIAFRNSLPSGMMLKEQLRGNNNKSTMGVSQSQQKTRHMRVSKSDALRELPMLLQPLSMQKEQQPMLTSEISRSSSEMKRLCLKEGQSFSNKLYGIDNNSSQLSHRSSVSQQQFKKKQFISNVIQKEGESMYERPDWLKNILIFNSENNNKEINTAANDGNGALPSPKPNPQRRLLQQCQKLNIPIDMESIQALSASKLQLHHNQSQSQSTQSNTSISATKNSPNCGGIRDYMRTHNYFEECARLKTFYRFGVNTQSNDENNQKLQNIVKQVIPSNEKGTLACNELWSDKHMKKIHDRANFAKEKSLIAEYIAFKERNPTGRDKMESPSKRDNKRDVKEWKQVNEENRKKGQKRYQEIMTSLQGKRQQKQNEEGQTQKQEEEKLNDDKGSAHHIDCHTISPTKRKQNQAESQAEQLVFREFLSYTDRLIHNNQDDMMDIRHQLKEILDAKKQRK